MVSRHDPIRLIAGGPQPQRYTNERRDAECRSGNPQGGNSLRRRERGLGQNTGTARPFRTTLPPPEFRIVSEIHEPVAIVDLDVEES